MNIKAVTALGLALVLGLMAAFLAKNAVSRRAAPQATNLVAVVVAKQDAEPGHVFTKDDIVSSKVPADIAPGQVFSDPAQLVGRVTTTQLMKGQVILETLLAPAGTSGGLQSLVPPGMRAITLEVSEFSSVGGMLTPGCHVDVISIVHDDKTSQSMARTILQNIKVQAVGRSLNAHAATDAQQNGQPAQAANNVTLLCTPKQAQMLQLATTTSRPWFVLRSAVDGKDVSVDGTTMAELRGDAAEQRDTDAVATQEPGPSDPDIFAPTPATPTVEPAPPAPTADAPTPVPAVVKRVVQIFRGSTESQVTFVVPNPRAASATADVPLAPEAH